MEMYEEASQVANDAVGGIRTIASFLWRIEGLGFFFFVVFCTNTLIFYAGAHLVQDGKTTFSNVFRHLESRRPAQ